MSVLNLKRVTSLHFILDQVVWNVEEIKAFLQRNSSTVNKVNHDQETPLFRVLKSESCSFGFVEVLLKYGAEVNGRNFDGETPLMVALYHSRGYAIIEALLEKGADASLLNESSFFNEGGKWNVLSGSTTLCYALRFGASKDVIKLLLEVGCHPNACEQHSSALKCASDLPNDALGEGILELLVNAGSNLLIGYESPVCLALKAGAGVKDIEWLLRQGVTLNACNEHDSIWLCATSYADVYYDRLLRTGIGWNTMLRSDVIELLSKEGAGSPMDEPDVDSESPLDLALSICKYETEAIKILLDFPGVDVNVRTYMGNNLLHRAVENCYCEPRVIELLIERGTKVDEVNSEKQTPLHAAICFGSKFWKLSVQRSIISIILKNNSPVNAVDKKGKTPLKVAVESERHSDIVHLLLSAGARIDCGFSGGYQDYGFPLLRLALNQYLKKKCQFILDSLKLLIKYYFLENPDFKIERLTKRKSTDILAAELKHLAEECAREVQIMSTNIDDHHTLLDLIRERSLPKIVAADQNPALSGDCFNNILRIMAGNTISYFLANIAAMIGKSAMHIKLQELQVYSIKKRPASSHMEEKVILIYDCVRKITSFLSQEDTMRLILAFYIPTNHTSRKDSVRNNMKRKYEES